MKISLEYKTEYEQFILKPYTISTNLAAKIAFTALSILFEIATLGTPFWVKLFSLVKNKNPATIQTSMIGKSLIVKHHDNAENQGDRQERKSKEMGITSSPTKLLPNQIPLSQKKTLSENQRKSPVFLDQQSYFELINSVFDITQVRCPKVGDIKAGQSQIFDTSHPYIKCLMVRKGHHLIKGLVVQSSRTPELYRYFYLVGNSVTLSAGKFTLPQLHSILLLISGDIPSSLRLSKVNQIPQYKLLGMPILTNKEVYSGKDYFLVNRLGFLNKVNDDLIVSLANNVFAN